MGKFLCLPPGHLDPGGDGDADQGLVTPVAEDADVKLGLTFGLEVGVSQHLPGDLDIHL